MKQNSLEHKFKVVLENFSLYKAESWVLAVSGGVDSMVMLDLFRRFSDLPFKVAYFDHGIRADVIAEKKLIADYCALHSLEFKLGGGVKILEMEGNIEANARKLRYEFLSSVRQKGGLIVTAHHQDDQVETVFMNFLKGSFVSGLAGMARFDESRHLWRPLLDFKKSELIAFAHNNGLDYVEDVTNQNQDFLRNYCRNKILPDLTDRFGSLGVLARNADFYAEMSIYLDKEVEQFLQSNMQDSGLNRSAVAELPAFLRFELYQKLLLGGYCLSVADFKQLDELVLFGETGKFRQMGEVCFVVEKAVIKVVKG